MDTQRTANTVTVEALAIMGAEQLAYVKPERAAGQTIYVVYGATGEKLGGFSGREVAFAACRQNDLEPVSVH